MGNVPKLRFPEFKGEWESKKLGDVSVEIKRDLKDKSDLSDMEVLTISSEKGFISQKERFSQVIAGNSLSKYTLLTKGEMSYNKGASKRFKYGCFYSLNQYDKALVPNVYISFAFKQGFESDFYNQLFSTGFANRQLRQFISSSVRLDGLLNINRDDFFSISVPTPNHEEQIRIASFFTLLDKKIAQLKQKKTLLEQYKKGVMQKLFSQELRFKDEYGKEFPEWEEKKLGVISEIKTGNKDTQNREENGSFPFFVRSDTVERINSYSYEGEAILTSGDGVGVGKNFHYINGKFDFHQRVYSIRKFCNGINGKYIFFYFSTFFFDRVKRVSAKNSVDSVRMEMIAEMPIGLPCIAEQTKIANFLSSIDEKINRTETQIQQIQEYKKGLLQNMFC